MGGTTASGIMPEAVTSRQRCCPITRHAMRHECISRGSRPAAQGAPSGAILIFYAILGGQRIFSLDLPDDQARFHDLAKLGVFIFQSKHPKCSLVEDAVQFGFERAPSDQ